ncbi:MAG: DUF1002 domain-containing protein [Peptococcaceae bacterium]|jgi:uncharacterized protein YpuA (DUF1002 family)|nr:DUF1002 domain-containing protein [Peptococcaceae bacterium]
MNHLKNKLISATLILGLLASPMAALADAAVGDQIVTLGTNLNQQQRQEVLQYFGTKQNAQIIDVDISEEREYLSGKVPEAQIGNSTNSCAMITYTSKGSGVNVTTHNINYVTPDAYKSAILTAGINDADVQVTAPIEVSGTGALTGIMKAYEVSTGEKIDEDVKQAATSELVTNAELGQAIGDKQANEVINGIKQEIAEQDPKTEADLRDIIDQVLAQLGITLTDEQYQQLLDMIKQLAALDIDWNALANNVSSLVNQASDYLQTEEGQGFLAKVQALFNDFIDWLRSIFGGGGSESGAVNENVQTTEPQTNEQVQSEPEVVPEQNDNAADNSGDVADDGANVEPAPVEPQQPDVQEPTVDGGQSTGTENAAPVPAQ